MSGLGAISASDEELARHSEVGDKSQIVIEFKPKELAAAIDSGDTCAFDCRQWCDRGRLEKARVEVFAPAKGVTNEEMRQTPANSLDFG